VWKGYRDLKTAGAFHEPPVHNKGVKDMKRFPIIVGVGLVLFLACGPYNTWVREEVVIDLAKRSLQITFADVRPLFADSIKQGWKEIVNFVDSNDRKIDSSHFPYYSRMDTAFLERRENTLNCVMRIGFYCDSVGAGPDWLTWEIFNRVLDDQYPVIKKHGEVLLNVSPMVFDSYDRIETSVRSMRSERNCVLFFPDSLRRVQFTFFYNVDSLRAAAYRGIERKVPAPEKFTNQPYLDLFAKERGKKKR
jgi:hypothetical protein